jgi:DNA processing protein
MSAAASWLPAALLPAMTDRLFHLLRGAFPDGDAALAAGAGAIARAARIPPERAAALVSPEARAAAAASLAGARAVGHTLLAFGDEAYPRLLREVFEPPRFLAVLGALDDAEERRVAIVGSRHTDGRARDAAGDLARALARRGYAVVSGLARGVDTAAHEGALEGGGRTIAVLGTGLDALYPEENEDLARRAAASGALVSPFPPGTPPLKPNFPMRNKTIAGLCRAVVVVQAPVRSGALITARLALHANREVFAMPGPVGEVRYAGSNRLLREGAHVCLDLGDVIAEMEGAGAALAYWNEVGAGDDAGGRGRARAGRAAGGSPAADPLAAEERALLEALTGDPAHVDEIARAADLAPAALLPLLLALEMKGAVRALPGAHYARRVSLGP